ncbi:MAG: hypothetical protein ACRCWG_06680, partial [Sarcina sp.]
KPAVETGTTTIKVVDQNGTAIGSTTTTGTVGTKVNVPNIPKGDTPIKITDNGTPIKAIPSKIEKGDHTIVITVIPKVKPKVVLPIVNGHNVTITEGSHYDNGMIGGNAIVNGHNVKVTYTGNVNPNKVGTYNVTVIGTNNEGKTTSKIVTVTVVPKAEPQTVTNGYNTEAVNVIPNNPSINSVNNATRINTITQLPKTGISGVVETTGVVEALVGLISLSLATVASVFGFRKKRKKKIKK